MWKKSPKYKELTDMEKVLTDIVGEEGPMSVDQLVQRFKEIIGLEFFDDEDDLESVEPTQYTESYAAIRSSENTSFFVYKSQIMNIFNPWVKVKSSKVQPPATRISDRQISEDLIAKALAKYCPRESNQINPANLYTLLLEIEKQVRLYEKKVENAKEQKLNLLISKAFEATFGIIKESNKNKKNVQLAFTTIWNDLRKCYINAIREINKYFVAKPSSNQSAEMIKFLTIIKKYASYFDRYISDILKLNKFSSIARPYFLRDKIVEKLNENDYWKLLCSAAAKKGNPPKSWNEITDFLMELDYFKGLNTAVQTPNINLPNEDDIRFAIEAEEDLLTNLYLEFSNEKKNSTSCIVRILEHLREFVLFKSLQPHSVYHSVLFAFLHQFIQIGFNYINNRETIPLYLFEAIYDGLIKLKEVLDLKNMSIQKLSLDQINGMNQIDENILESIITTLGNQIKSNPVNSTRTLFFNEQYRVKALAIVFSRLRGQISLTINTVSKFMPVASILPIASKLNQWLNIKMAQYIDYLDTDLLPFSKKEILEELDELANHISAILALDVNKNMTVLQAVENQIRNLKRMLGILFQTVNTNAGSNTDFGLFYTCNVFKFIYSIKKRSFVPNMQKIVNLLHPPKPPMSVTNRAIATSHNLDLNSASFDEIVKHKFYFTESPIYGSSKKGDPPKSFILIPPTLKNAITMQQTLIRSIRLRQLYLQDDKNPYEAYIANKNIKGLSSNVLKNQTDIIEELKQQRTIAYNVFNVLNTFSNKCLNASDQYPEDVVRLAENIRDAFDSDTLESARKTIRWAIHQFIEESEKIGVFVLFPILGLKDKLKINQIITMFNKFLDFKGEWLVGLYRKSPNALPEFTYNGQTYEYATFGALEVCQIHMKESMNKTELAVIFKMNINDLQLDKVPVFVQHLIFKKGKEGVFLPIIEEIRAKAKKDSHYRFLNYIMHYGKENNNDPKRLISQPMLVLRDGGRLDLNFKIKIDKAFKSYEDVHQSIGFDPGIRSNKFGVYLNKTPVPYGVLEPLNPAVWGYGGIGSSVNDIGDKLDLNLKRYKDKIASIEVKTRSLRSQIASKLNAIGLGYMKLNNTDVIRDRIACRTIRQLLLLRSYFERISNLHDYIAKSIYHSMKCVVNEVENSTQKKDSTRIIVEDNRSLHADRASKGFSKSLNRAISDFERGKSRQLIVNYFQTRALVIEAPSYYSSSRCSHCGAFLDKGYIIFKNNSFEFNKNGGGNLIKCRNAQCDIAGLFSNFLTLLNSKTTHLIKNGKIVSDYAYFKYLSLDRLNSQIMAIQWLNKAEKEIITKTYFFLDRDANASHNFARFLPFQSTIFTNLIKTARQIRTYYPNQQPKDQVILAKNLEKSYKVLFEKKFDNTFNQNETTKFRLAGDKLQQIGPNAPIKQSFDLLIGRMNMNLNYIKEIFKLRAKIHNFFSRWLNKSPIFLNNILKTPEDLFLLIAYGSGPPGP